MARTESALIVSWISEPLSPPVSEQLSRWARTDGVRKIAVMPDVHLAEGICVGAVVCADRIFPEAVGTDIGCGMATMRLSANRTLLEGSTLARQILQGLRRVAPSNRHPLGRQPDWLPSSCRAAHLSHETLASRLDKDGAVQFGTLGRGNHFLEIQADDADRLWLAVHSGSRGMGQAIAAHHLSRAERANTGILFFNPTDPKGRAYLQDAAFAVDYARRSRRRLLEAAEMLLGELCGVEGDWTTYFDSVHNFVRIEAMDGEALIHRKGANSASEGEPSLIPGSMGTPSYQVVGKGRREALCSCAHGAGRSLSRTEARRAVSTRRFSNEMKGIYYDRDRIEKLRDEAPGAYKNIDRVMRAQKPLVRRIRKLWPVLSYKGT